MNGLDYINNCLCFTSYSKSRKKNDELLQQLKEIEQLTTLLTVVCQMFDTQGDIPENVNLAFMEIFAHLDGIYCYTKNERGEELVLPCGLAGDLDPYGIGRDVVVYQLNGETFNRRRGENCVVGYNVPQMFRDFSTILTAQQLSEILCSARYNTFYSRVNKIPCVTNSKDKEKVDTAIKNMLKGVLNTVLVEEKDIVEQINGAVESIKMLDLTDPETTHNLQYLSKYYDDVLSRYLTIIGLPINFSGKMAQMSTDEVSGYHALSCVLPSAMLNARRTFWDEVNEMFGRNITVEYSESWQHLKNEKFHSETKDIEEKEVTDDEETIDNE